MICPRDYRIKALHHSQGFFRVVSTHLMGMIRYDPQTGSLPQAGAWTKSLKPFQFQWLTTHSTIGSIKSNHGSRSKIKAVQGVPPAEQTPSLWNNQPSTRPKEAKMQGIMYNIYTMFHCFVALSLGGATPSVKTVARAPPPLSRWYVMTAVLTLRITRPGFQVYLGEISRPALIVWFFWCTAQKVYSGSQRLDCPRSDGYISMWRPCGGHCQKTHHLYVKTWQPNWMPTKISTPQLENSIYTDTESNRHCFQNKKTQQQLFRPQSAWNRGLVWRTVLTP